VIEPLVLTGVVMSPALLCVSLWMEMVIQPTYTQCNEDLKRRLLHLEIGHSAKHRWLKIRHWLDLESSGRYEAEGEDQVSETVHWDLLWCHGTTLFV
jgi:hypothetical protein